jgi:molybdopterin converting factor small subunit
MRVTLTFLGIIRDKVGQKSLDVELPDGSGFDDLMQAIAPLMREKLDGWAWDDSRCRFSPQVIVSRGRAVGGVDLSAPLEEGEEVLVFPPLAGG